MTPTRPPATTPADGADRAAPDPRLALLLDRDPLPGTGSHELREALCDAAESWLAETFTDLAAAGEPSDPLRGLALVALGSLGRRELVPGADLDLLLLHEPEAAARAGAVAEALWYRIWDAGLSLDHSVRTVAASVEVAEGEVTAALGLLDARHLLGDEDLSGALRETWLDRWRSRIQRRLPEVREAAEQRWERAGEMAFLLEPNVKESRGGLRDGQLLTALAYAQVADRWSPAVAAAYGLLLDVRTELRRGAARPSDTLVLQEQARVAAALREAHGTLDADVLLQQVSAAARTVSHAVEVTWRRLAPAAPSQSRRWLSRGRPLRRPLAEGVVAQGREVVLAANAVPAEDPILPLRVAAAAAEEGLLPSPGTLERLVTCPPLPRPWPVAARETFVRLLGAGRGLVAVQDAFDQAGLWSAMLPEWDHTRARPQRNALHRFTVDRHLIEAVVAASTRTRRVQRPDLLLVGSLLHDIGKGLPGDHTEVGVRIVTRLAPALGFNERDTDVLVAMVQNHLLLADVAVRRDLHDPATIDLVARAIGGSREVLELLVALTESDAAATGPAAWSRWKGLLVDELVRRVSAVLNGEPPPLDPEPDETQQALLAEVAAGAEVAVAVDRDLVSVAAPDRTGLLGLVAGVLSLHRLHIHGADVRTLGDTSLAVFAASPRFGTPPEAVRLRADLRRALAGSLDVPGELARRAAAYPAPRVPTLPPVVLWPDERAQPVPGARLRRGADAAAADPAALVEVRAPDGLGVLHAIADALAAGGRDVVRARCSTLGAEVVDAFYVRPPVAPAERPAVETAVLSALTRASDASDAARTE